MCLPSVTARREAARRVFISCAPGSAEHEAEIHALGEVLTNAGFRLQSDRCHLGFDRGWNEWIATQILRSDFILVVVSQPYRDAVRADAGMLGGLVNEYRHAA